MPAREMSCALRLVNTGVVPGRRAVATGRDRPARLSRAEPPAPGLSADDARWVLARRTGERLQGGRAAILSPDDRARLAALGRRLGLRPFDTNLVVAIAQDHARTGEASGGKDYHDRLRMVPGPGGGSGSAAAPVSAWRLWPWVLTACGVAAALAFTAGRWVVG